VDERTEGRADQAEERFERAAERFRHAGALLERAADRFGRSDGRAERAAEKSGRPDGRTEADGGAERADRSRPEERNLAQPEHRIGRTDGHGRAPTGERELRMDLLARELDRLSNRLERAKIAEYVDLLNRPLSLVWRNFVGGMARGIGIAIGFTFFAATILYVLQLLGKLNLPIIGDYIADIVRIVQRQLEGRTY
jgi:hypothetical protein